MKAILISNEPSKFFKLIFFTELSEKLKDYEKKIKLKLEDEFGDRLLDMHLDIDEAVEKVSQQFVMVII